MALKIRGALAALVAGLALSAGAVQAHDVPAQAPSAPGAKAAWARHGAFRQLGGAFKALNDELKKDGPDKGVLTASATKMNALAGQLPSWFPKGSGPESGFKTDAKAGIWTDAAGFAAAATKLQGETAKLNQVAGAGDVNALKAQVRATGAACKTCHETYRVPEQH